jgi:hypothetical protein
MNLPTDLSTICMATMLRQEALLTTAKCIATRLRQEALHESTKCLEPYCLTFVQDLGKIGHHSVVRINRD